MYTCIWRPLSPMERDTTRTKAAVAVTVAISIAVVCDLIRFLKKLTGAAADPEDKRSAGGLKAALAVAVAA